MNDIYLKLFSTVLLVKGQSRSSIYNFSAPYLYPIPHILSSILEESKKYPYDYLIQKYCKDKKDFDAFSKYISFLETKKLVFWTKEPHLFSEIDICYNDSSTISSSVIEYNFCNYDLRDVLMQLEQLFCKHIEIRLNNLSKCKISQFKKTIFSILEMGFKSIDFVFNYEDSNHLQYITDLIPQFKNINRIIILNSPIRKVINNKVFYISQTTSKKGSFKHVLDLKYFCESHFHNPYFNKKVCVDANGYIKNYILQKKEFGNVFDSKLEPAVLSTEFTKLWNVSHDQIINIKDNEYRYSLYLPFELEQKDQGMYWINFDKMIY